MSGQWEAKACGSKEPHGQHIWVENPGIRDAVAYACFGYHPPEEALLP